MCKFNQLSSYAKNHQIPLIQAFLADAICRIGPEWQGNEHICNINKTGALNAAHYAILSQDLEVAADRLLLTIQLTTTSLPEWAMDTKRQREQIALAAKVAHQLLIFATSDLKDQEDDDAPLDFVLELVEEENVMTRMQQHVAG